MSHSSREYPQRPLVGVGMVLLRNDGGGASSVLLIKRGRPPAMGQWSFPGGAQRLGETAEAAARRELLEETGLTCGPLRLATYADSIHHDATGKVRFHYTILNFCGWWQGAEARAGGDAMEVAWAPLADLAAFDLAPEIHRAVVVSAGLLAAS